ncbi:MAG: hypothetical protein JWO84_711 [Parcubacteria group bacterium]|nr:hypothetical protein [Parcubacteria group bacterium]
MKPKREVSSNLGRTQHGRADKLYREIKKQIGPTRRCPFYNGSKYPQFKKNEHDRLNPKYLNPNVPLEQYDFALDKMSGSWKLQAYCKVCYKAYRDARIQRAREMWVNKSGKPMSETQIRKWFTKTIGPEMRCSVCKKLKAPDHFPISRSMEKGLHNECYDCMSAKGTSVREQAWLSGGDWSSWKAAIQKMRLESTVVCAGWPRAQAAGICLISVAGKYMHADHKVPLRAGGINDARNFQPLCRKCNIKKSDQIDPRLRPSQIKNLVNKEYIRFIKDSDSSESIERKLKAALFARINNLYVSGKYLEAIRKKKKEVNGQWSPEHAFQKGTEWVKRGGKRITEN